jgi:hypothetical protein
MARAHSTRPPKPANGKRMGQRFCSLVPRRAPQLPDSVTVDPHRAAAILAGRAKWVNGTVLHYCFFTAGHFSVPKVQSDAVRKAVATWESVGIGLRFEEVDQLSEAEVRIG